MKSIIKGLVNFISYLNYNLSVVFFVIVDKIYNTLAKDYSINFKHFIKLPKLFRKCKTTTFRPGQFQFAVRHELENERR